MHTLTQYLWMVGDAVRVNAYTEAIRAVVRPGDAVIDLGAGFGYFSVIAARAGAARVEAIETSPVVHLGPAVAAANGCADRIVFHACDSTTLTLPAAADVLIADLRRQTPFSRRALATIVDARHRLLRPGARVIAARDTLMVAPAVAPRAFRHDLQALERADGVDLAPVARIVRDTPHPYHIEPDALVAPGAPWAVVDYLTVDTTGCTGEAAWTLAGAASIGGLIVWFESDLAPGVRLSCAPGSPGHTYGQLFLPLQRPVDVGTGTRIRVRIGAHPAGDDYVWQWELWIETGGEWRRAAAQNSLAETALDPAALSAANPPHI